MKQDDHKVVATDPTPEHTVTLLVRSRAYDIEGLAVEQFCHADVMFLGENFVSQGMERMIDRNIVFKTHWSAL